MLRMAVAADRLLPRRWQAFLSATCRKTSETAVPGGALVLTRSAFALEGMYVGITFFFEPSKDRPNNWGQIIFLAQILSVWNVCLIAASMNALSRAGDL